MTIKLLACCVATILVTACTSVAPLKPAGAKVVMTTATPPASCHFLKALTLGTSNGIDTAYRSHQDIESDQLNQLRNNTARLGGNVLVITEHETTYQAKKLQNQGILTSAKSVQAATPNTLVHRHVMSGDAYLCDTTALATLSATPNEALKLNDVVSSN